MMWGSKITAMNGPQRVVTVCLHFNQHFLQVLRGPCSFIVVPRNQPAVGYNLKLFAIDKNRGGGMQMSATSRSSAGRQQLSNRKRQQRFEAFEALNPD